MTIPVRLENRVDGWPVRVDLPNAEFRPKSTKNRTSNARVPLSAAELAFRIFASFRVHPHINNVLTHISEVNWLQVERALNSIFDPTTASEELSPLARNVVDLMWAERGVTGKIIKPYFRAALDRLLEPNRAERLVRHIEMLFIEIEWKAEHPVPVPNQQSRENGHDRAEHE